MEHNATAIGLSALLVSTSKQMPLFVNELHRLLRAAVQRVSPSPYLTDADARAFVFAEMERAKRARGMDAPASPARLAPTSAATGSASLTPGGGLMGAPSGSNR